MEIQLTKDDFLLLIHYQNIQKDGVKIKLDFWENLDFGEMKDLISCMINSFPRSDIDINFPGNFQKMKMGEHFGVTIEKENF